MITDSPCLVDIGPIDWSELKASKKWLIKHNDGSEEAEGLLSFLDHVQDYAVDVLGIPEDEVFDLDRED